MFLWRHILMRHSKLLKKCLMNAMISMLEHLIIEVYALLDWYNSTILILGTKFLLHCPRQEWHRLVNQPSNSVPSTPNITSQPLQTTRVFQRNNFQFAFQLKVVCYINVVLWSIVKNDVIRVERKTAEHTGFEYNHGCLFL